jgi:hypothetical protein
MVEQEICELLGFIKILGSFDLRVLIHEDFKEFTLKRVFDHL